MDHIPLPQDRGVPFVLEVPYTAAQATRYDGQGWLSFPSRCGYDTRDGTNTYLRVWQHLPADAELKAFLQSWLYFGLLEEVFGDLYLEIDFISGLYDEGPALLDTATLDRLILSKRDRDLWRPETSLEEVISELKQRRPKWYSRSTVELERVLAILNQAKSQAREWDLYTAGRDESWAKLILSIHVLIESLQNLTLDLSHYSASHFGQIALHTKPAAWLICQHMISNNGWCLHQVKHVCATVSYCTLLYLANLKRYSRPGVDHSACAQAERCIVYNITDTTFQGVHTSDGCRCERVFAPRDTLVEILDNGGIAVLSCQRSNEGKIEMTYVSASMGLQYTVVSHVWADGLGDPNSNSLPTCQLNRILDLVEEGEYDTHLFPLGRSIHNRLRRTTNVWLDVYCIPVLLKSSARTVQYGPVSESDQDQARRLKIKRNQSHGRDIFMGSIRTCSRSRAGPRPFNAK